MCNAISSKIMGEDIKILKVQQVEDMYNARHYAKKRTYTYRIYQSEYKTPFIKNKVWHIDEKKQLNIEAMRLGASYLIGKKDFTSFKRTTNYVIFFCKKKNKDENNIKNMISIDIEEVDINKNQEFPPSKYREIRLTFTANSFLYNQIRLIVGQLYLVGIGKINHEGIVHFEY
jgi:tRNA pseudouridine38-40 synthase